jgi:transcriptional regulator with XRE-family HTH domain
MTFGDKLRFYRRELELTQATLGEMLGVTARTVRNWEAGKTARRWGFWQRGMEELLDELLAAKRSGKPLEPLAAPPVKLLAKTASKQTASEPETDLTFG